MSLKELVEQVLAQLLVEHGLCLQSEVMSGFDGKTGEAVETVIFSGRQKRLMIERRDGGLEASVEVAPQQWRNVRSIDESLHQASISDLLQLVPDNPVGDSDALIALVGSISFALRGNA